jgi:hypothetical protein
MRIFKNHFNGIKKSGLFFLSLQILDGFVLAASTDGTLLYASDNVLQYLGFNQVHGH